MDLMLGYFSKCIDCLYETPTVQYIDYKDNFHIEIEKGTRLIDVIPKDFFMVKLKNLFAIRNITCSNCHGNRLGLCLVSVNDQTYKEFSNLSEDDNQTNEFEIHKKLSGFVRKSPVIITTKNDTNMLIYISGILTNLSTGDKSYDSILYAESNNLEDLKNIDIDDCQEDYIEINLSDIKKVSAFR